MKNMNNLILICSDTFIDISSSDFPEQQADIPELDIKVFFRKIEFSPEWNVLVYREPPLNESGHFIGNYLEHIAQQIEGVDCTRLYVFFHFTRILESPPDYHICQRKYHEYEQQLRSLINISNEAEVLVCGFHREKGLWDVIKELPNYISKIQPFQASITNLNQDKNFQSYLLESYDSSPRFLQSYVEKIDQTIEALLPSDNEYTNRFDVAIELLQMFLPLDIELQLENGDGYVERCRETAAKLGQQEAMMKNMIDKITEQENNLRKLSYQSKSNTFSTTAYTRASDHLRKLLPLARKAQTAGREELLEIFGFRFENGTKKVKDGKPDLNENGFHKLYEGLRDNLLDLV